MENPSQDQKHYPAHIQALVGKNEIVVNQLRAGKPPHRQFEHAIDIEEGSKLMISTPYRHPRRFKDEIEKAIKELLEMGNIRPNSSHSASVIVLVKKKYGTMGMCIDYRELKKNTIKNQYPMLNIHELTENFHGVVYFSKVDLRSQYHHIGV
jgi:hypothetical protein